MRNIAALILCILPSIGYSQQIGGEEFLAELAKLENQPMVCDISYGSTRSDLPGSFTISVSEDYISVYVTLNPGVGTERVLYDFVRQTRIPACSTCPQYSRVESAYDIAYWHDDALGARAVLRWFKEDATNGSVYFYNKYRSVVSCRF